MTLGLEDGYIFMATAAAIFVVAGTVKGAIGIGLPTTAMSLMLLFFDPAVALGLVILPIVITNGQQFFSTPNKRETVRNYWPFSAWAMVSIFLTSVYALQASVDYLRLIIAIVILLFCLSQFFKVRLNFVVTHDKLSQGIFGILAGICGGLTSIWAPPIMIYTMSKGVKKEEFIASAGFLIFTTSLPLLSGLWLTGIVSQSTLIVSCICVVGSVSGFMFGAKLRRFINEQVFRYLILGFFTIAGLRLLATELDRFF